MASPEDLHSKFLADNTDPRSLIVRVLVAAGRVGLSSTDVVEFLEESFGVFQKKSIDASWAWNKTELMQALKELRSHKLVEQDKDGLYHLTQLGRLSGESGVEVESIIRVVDGLSGVSPANISGPTLITLTQITTELDQVVFPLNRKSTQKEPQTWMHEISKQGVAAQIMRAISRSTIDAIQPTLRAKKAVACLLYITDRPLTEIENTMTQFGGRLNGAAGPIKNVTSRTCDILPTVASIATLIYPNLDLNNRVQRLLARLELGIPANLVELGTRIGRISNWGNYLNLLKAGIETVEQFENTRESVLLTCFENNLEKLEQVKLALENYRTENPPIITPPVLPLYED